MKKLEACDMYGVWNTFRKEFQFGIKVEKLEYAEKALRSKIQNDVYKYRFQCTLMTPKLVHQHNLTQIKKQEHKIRELKTRLDSECQLLEKFKKGGINSV